MPKTKSKGLLGLIKSSIILQLGIFVVLLSIAFAIYNGANISLWGLEVNNNEVEEVTAEEWDEIPYP